ncbi:MAG: zinc-ribbon domain-containing protein [Clostridia bacterium]|nr:zinc-ribbon domain-containing protein [Clostridia bacterium]
MYCSRCGKALRDGDRFCSFCGAKVFRTDIEQPENGDEIVYNPDFNEEEQSRDVSAEVGEDRRTTGAPAFESTVRATEKSTEYFEEQKPQKEQVPVKPQDAPAREEKQEPKQEADKEPKKEADKEPKQEQKTEPKVLDNSEFVWNLHEFPSDEPRKTEDIDFNWRINTFPGVEKQNLSPAEQKEITPEKGRTEAAAPEGSKSGVSDISTGAGSRFPESGSAFAQPEAEKASSDRIIDPVVSPEEAPVTGSDLEKEIFGESELSEEEKQTIKIEKFYTFNKKKEEFQKLLDKEYEKIRSSRLTAEDTTEGFRAAQQEEMPNLSDLPEIPQKDSADEAYEKWKPEAQMEELRKHLEAATALEEKESAARTSEVRKTADFDPVQHLKQAEKEREECMRSEPSTHDDEAQMGRPQMLQGLELDIMDNDAIARRFDTVELTRDMQEIYLEKEIRRQAELVEAEKKEKFIREALAPSAQEGEKAASAESTDERISAESTDSRIPPENLGRVPQDEGGVKEIFADSKGPEDIMPHGFLPSDAPEPVQRPAEEPPIRNLSAAEDKPPQPFSKTQALDELFGIREKEKEQREAPNQDDPADRNRKKGSGAGKALAVIVVLALVGELAILGIRAFAPESGAAEFLEKKMSITYEWLLGPGEETAQEEDAEPSTPAAIVNTPEVDKEKLIARVKSANKNIALIESDPALAYNPTIDYSDENIAMTVPLEQNIWYMRDDGTPAYFDEEIVRTLITFDSEWVDYVNKKDESVFTVIKPGSMADTNARAYEKAGKITETFNLLKIGEIRKSETGYYIWAEENVNIAEGGSSQDKTYKWVYYLEPEGNEMKLCSYTQFE